MFRSYNHTLANMFLTCAYYQKYYSLAANITDVSPDARGGSRHQQQPVPSNLMTLKAEDVGLHPLIQKKTGIYTNVDPATPCSGQYPTNADTCALKCDPEAGYRRAGTASGQPSADRADASVTLTCRGFGYGLAYYHIDPPMATVGF